MSTTAIETAGVRNILGEGGAIARRLPGYEPRPQQLAMAEAVAHAIAVRATASPSGRENFVRVPGSVLVRILAAAATRGNHRQFLPRIVAASEAKIPRYLSRTASRTCAGTPADIVSAIAKAPCVGRVAVGTRAGPASPSRRPTGAASPSRRRLGRGEEPLPPPRPGTLF